jgi:hypothetical protein
MAERIYDGGSKVQSGRGVMAEENDVERSRTFDEDISRFSHAD